MPRFDNKKNTQQGKRLRKMKRVRNLLTFFLLIK